MSSTSLVWLRNDLRISDNPALTAAAKNNDRIIALYVHEHTDGIRAPGGAARWWLHHSLVALGHDLASIGIELIIRSGESQSVLVETAADIGAQAVYWNRRYAPGECAVDAAIKTALRASGMTVASFGANVLVEPWDIETGQGRPYSVFTPYWKTMRSMDIAQPLPRLRGIAAPINADVDGDYVEPHWAGKMAKHWTVGEAAAQTALADFLDERLDSYPTGRDFPGRNVTSRLSPHLRFGEISPRQIWHASQMALHAEPERQAAIDKFLSELAWRDFSYHQLFHRADIANEPMQPKYARMHWRESRADLVSWQRGQTGLPIVDAGMRELWETGYMQNRVRMLVASVLAKNLLIDWREGERWFWDCLVDSDIASNPASWQWVAGSGLDAAPYFRIFNPVTQGEKFDGAGDYVRQWVPELACLPDKWLHRPAAAPKAILDAAGVQMGKTYPNPIVDLLSSRERALEAAADLNQE